MSELNFVKLNWLKKLTLCLNLMPVQWTVYTKDDRYMAQGWSCHPFKRYLAGVITYTYTVLYCHNVSELQGSAYISIQWGRHFEIFIYVNYRLQQEETKPRSAGFGQSVQKKGWRGWGVEGNKTMYSLDQKADFGVIMEFPATKNISYIYEYILFITVW